MLGTDTGLSPVPQTTNRGQQARWGRTTRRRKKTKSSCRPQAAQQLTLCSCTQLAAWLPTTWTNITGAGHTHWFQDLHCLAHWCKHFKEFTGAWATTLTYVSWKRQATSLASYSGREWCTSALQALGWQKLNLFGRLAQLDLVEPLPHQFTNGSSRQFEFWPWQAGLLRDSLCLTRICSTILPHTVARMHDRVSVLQTELVRVRGWRCWQTINQF